MAMLAAPLRVKFEKTFLADGSGREELEYAARTAIGHRRAEALQSKAGLAAQVRKFVDTRIETIFKAVNASTLIPTANLDIQVIPDDGWGDITLYDVHEMLADIAANLLKAFPQPQPRRSVVVAHTDGANPYSEFKGDHYLVLLTTRDRRWSQMTFQAAHEFTHIALDHLTELSHPCSNKEIEALAYCGSLLALHSIAKSWSKSEFAHKRDFAPSMLDYVMDCETKPLPRGSADDLGRKLLPHFMKRPSLWKQMVGAKFPISACNELKGLL